MRIYGLVQPGRMRIPENFPGAGRLQRQAEPASIMGDARATVAARRHRGGSCRAGFSKR